MSHAVIAVDLDGTLAVHDKSLHPPGGFNVRVIGPPVPAMLARVRRWLNEGRVVAIFTARVCPRTDDSHTVARNVIFDWLADHLGPATMNIAITHEKRPEFVEFWDDRAVAVEPNTGRILGAARALASPDPVQTCIDYLAGERARLLPGEDP